MGGASVKESCPQEGGGWKRFPTGKGQKHAVLPWDPSSPGRLPPGGHGGWGDAKNKKRIKTDSIPIPQNLKNRTTI